MPTPRNDSAHHNFTEHLIDAVGIVLPFPDGNGRVRYSATAPRIISSETPDSETTTTAPNGSIIISDGQPRVMVGGSPLAIPYSGSAVVTDTISESTSAAGVTIDGLLLKDGFVVAIDSQGLKLGTGVDDILLHDGTLTTWTHTTGTLSITNSAAAAFTVLKSGTATSATGVKIVDSADQVQAQFLSDGSGMVEGVFTSAGKVNNGSYVSGVRAVQSIADGGTIALPTTGENAIVATSTAANKTAVVLTVGVTTGQRIRLINTSANSITFDAAATSNVADGTGSVLAALTAMTLTWEAGAARWFREG